MHEVFLWPARFLKVVHVLMHLSPDPSSLSEGSATPDNNPPFCLQVMQLLGNLTKITRH